MNIGIYGTGYVGLVTGACLAEKGNRVVCYDKDSAKLNQLKSGAFPFFEPGLEALVTSNVADKRLSFTAKGAEAVAGADVVFLCVWTPPNPDGSANTVDLQASAREVVGNLTNYTVLVQKSTAPAGTARAMLRVGAEHTDRFDVAVNPEFLRQGSAISDFMDPDRIIIGTDSERAERTLRGLYSPWGDRIYRTDLTSAELVKVVSNTLLAQRIADANEVAKLADRIGANAPDVLRLVGMDGRIGPHFLNVGPGFGGSCFPKDVAAFVAEYRRNGLSSGLFEHILLANHEHKAGIVEKVERLCDGVDGKLIGVLGLAFKANTDDMRESPALDIVRTLLGKGARVQAYDPRAMEKAKLLLPSVEMRGDAYAALEQADAGLILTEWPAFRGLDLERVRQALKSPVLVDSRNLYSPDAVRKAGFRYEGVGTGRQQ